MTTLLTIALVILAVLLIGLILMQPDRSQGMNNSTSYDNPKEPIEQLTEYIAIAFLVIAVLFQLVR